MRKNLFLFVLISICAPVLSAQEKPLTQAEFVKLLYGLQGNTAKRDDLVDGIRRRGIDFELTSGLRGLVTSKGRNDEVLKRTLEEAARRRLNPTASALPSEKEAAEVLAKAKEATLAAVEEMPDFVVKQIIQRSVAYAGTGSWKSQDRLTVAVNYSTTKGEDYKVLAVNGNPLPEDKQNDAYYNSGGTTTTGEFVSILASIFKDESKTDFSTIDTDVLRGKRAIVYEFTIKRENLKRRVAVGNLFRDSVESGFRGKVWIDRENFRVLRVETEATEIPADFPIRAVKRFIDYDWVVIADQRYLLPSFSRITFTSRENNELFDSRNLIAFRNYQKYGSEVRILEDEEVIEEPTQKP